MDERHAKDESSRGFYKEKELRDRGVGKFIPTQTHEWALKLSTYYDEGVKKAFMALKGSFKVCATDCDNWVNYDMAHQMAEMMIDTFLLKRSKGLAVTVPGPMVPVSSLQSPAGVRPAAGAAVEPTATKADFTTWGGKIDAISDINWIYNNLMIKDVKPEDAPSPGAWAHLEYHRSNPEAMAKFFINVYPRLIPSKSVIEKEAQKNDDGRATFSLLDRLLKEEAESPDEVSVLQLGDQERPGLQNETRQSPVSEEVPKAGT